MSVIASRPTQVSLVDPDDGEIRELPVTEPGDALGAITRGEIDVQIATAKRYPRSVSKFLKQATEMVTADEDIAARCFYNLPRAGKDISGPSVRLAEIAVSAWGHIRAAARIIAEDDKWITAQAVCWDMESNVAVQMEVRRRITDKRGNKFNDDMVGVTANAACSIAFRNAVFRVIPNSFVLKLYNEAREVAIGNAQTLSARRASCIDAFGKMGVKPDQIFGLFNVKGIEEITLDHLGTLRGLFTAIKDGDTTIEEAFAPKQPTAAETVTDGLTKPPAPATLPQKAAEAPGNVVAGSQTSDPLPLPNLAPEGEGKTRGSKK